MAVPLKSQDVSLLNEAMRLWERYAGEYDALVKEYRSLLAKKREHNLRLEKIKESTFREDAPNVELLDIVSESGAKRYLSVLSDDELSYVIDSIMDYVDGPLRRTLQAKIWDYNYQINNLGVRKSAYAMNPEACGCGRSSKHPGNGPDIDR